MKKQRQRCFTQGCRFAMYDETVADWMYRQRITYPTHRRSLVLIYLEAVKIIEKASFVGLGNRIAADSARLR